MSASPRCIDPLIAVAKLGPSFTGFGRKFRARSETSGAGGLREVVEDWKKCLAFGIWQGLCGTGKVKKPHSVTQAIQDIFEVGRPAPGEIVEVWVLRARTVRKEFAVHNIKMQSHFMNPQKWVEMG